jgi:hypothetical protein
MRIVRSSGVLGGVNALFLFVCPALLAAPTTTPALQASVGPGHTISLRIPRAGTPPIVKAGHYTMVVRDRSRRDNFHLIGGGLNRKTGVVFVGVRQWSVTLTKGLYRYRSDTHPRSMFGSFQVS